MSLFSWKKLVNANNYLPFDNNVTLKKVKLCGFYIYKSLICNLNKIFLYFYGECYKIMYDLHEIELPKTI